MKMSATKEQCVYFSDCSAPFCPLDREHAGTAIWYPDEEICKVTDGPYWVLRQKKLAERTKDKTTCYTFAMIKWKCMIKKNINGIETAETIPKTKKLAREWMTNHKLKKPLSVKERQVRCDRLEKARKIRLELLSIESI